MCVAEAIQDYIGEPVIFYTHFPKVISLYSKLDVRSEDEFIPFGADWWITMNTLVLFNFQKNFKGFRNPKMRELFLNYRHFLSQGDWRFIVNRQPQMENYTGTEAVKMGLNRQTLIFKILGLEARELRKKSPILDKVLQVPYVTLHDGYDASNEHVQERSMKNWNLEAWEMLVESLRGLSVKTVQLGGETSRVIPGVDYNMVGKLSLVESMNVISQSALHIDTESGLVHAAHMFGVKSVVMFGPTNLKFFAYEKNINIAPKFCGDCWWLQESWMSKCVLGYLAPLCMDSIGFLEVSQKIKEELRERFQNRTR